MTSALQQKDRTYQWIRTALVIVSLFSLFDFLIRHTIGNIHIGSLNLESIAGGWKELLIIALYVLWYLKKQTYGEATPHITRLHWMIAIAFIGAALSIVASYVAGGSQTFDVKFNTWYNVHETLPIAIAGLRNLLEPTLYFFVLVALIEDEDTLREMTNLMIFAATVIAIYGVYQRLSGMKTPASWVYSDVEGGATRVFSTFIGPNSLGGYLVLFTPLALSFALFSKNIKDRIIYGLAAGIMLLCMLFTLSRGAWIGFLAGVGLYVLITKKWKLLAAALVVVAGVALFVPSISDRLTMIFSSEYLQKSRQAGRLQFWYRAYQIWLQQPVFGTGLGLVGDSVAVEHKVVASTWIDNQYMRLLAETGIVGIVTYVAMLLTPVIKGWKWMTAQRNHSTFRYALNAGIMAAVFGMIVENVTAAIFDTTVVITYFWVLIAMLYVSIRLSKTENA